MAPTLPTSLAPGAGGGRPSTRTRRSRYGCRNCKLRKLKCDEAKPRCMKCTSFGVVCNYMSNLPYLEPIIHTTTNTRVWTEASIAPLLRVIPAQRGGRLMIPPPRPRSVIPNAVWTSDTSGSYRFQLDSRLQKLISRYFGENMVGSYEPSMAAVNEKLLKLAFSHPFLMHACIAGALAYDRYMEMISTPHWSSDNGTPRRSLQECYHLSQSTVLLNRHLQDILSGRQASTPELHDGVRNETRDPIWGTASLIAMVTFCSPSLSRDASTPQESWPLAASLPSELSSASAPSCGVKNGLATSNTDGKDDEQAVDRASEFNWSRMTNSKMALWDFVDPLRAGSIFSVLAHTFADMNPPLPDSGIDGLPRDLANLCKLSSHSNVDSSPYFQAAHAVGHLWSAECMVSNQEDANRKDETVKVGATQVFTRVVSGAFEDLLKKRDPVALLLLYLWYCKARRGIWWIELRARVEVPAIRQYLLRHHGSHVEVLRFLGH